MPVLSDRKASGRPGNPLPDPCASVARRAERATRSDFASAFAKSRTKIFEDRDYEILSLMADGIKPILDRLDDIENRVGGMEVGELPVPNDVRGWLNSQMADTFRPGGEVALGRTVQDLESRLPRLIEEAVTTRFNQMAGKLQEEIEETHIRTLETFVKNIQVKLVQRVSALEIDMGKQAEAMQQLREYSQRTEDNLGRLISGVDRLAVELPKRLALPSPEQNQSRSSMSSESRPSRRRSDESSFSPKVFWAVVGTILLIVTASVAISRANRVAPGPKGAAPAPSASETLTPPAELKGGSDVQSKLQAAQQYSDRKDYATAEDIYKQIIKADPGNVDAMKALASVLYREDKIEESAAILEKLPKN